MVSKSTAADQLIAHISTFRDGAWAPAVLRRTQLCLLDSIGCFAAGLSLEHFAPSLIVANRLFAVSASHPRSKLEISPFAMAYLYGQAANALDYDDTLLIGHPGAPIIGAVLSVTAREHLPVDRLLRGIAAGYEAEMILGASAMPSRERSAQVRSVGVWDTVAASIGIAVALSLEDSLLERVIGVAVAHSLLPYTAKWYERPVPALKNNLGWAAAGAVLSVDLALAGQTGITNPLEGDTGMWRMAGSDRWKLLMSITEKPAVLRTGFKHYPVCWHLQAYLKTFSDLLSSMSQEDEVREILLAAPQDIERFCQRKIFNSADIAFSLPSTFSLLMSGVDPGPQWDSVDDTADVLRYRDLFRFQRSDSGRIFLRTRKGLSLEAPVPLSDPLDRAATGLDETGVLAKHRRLTDSALRADVADAFALGQLPSEGSVPVHLYGAVDRMLVNLLRAAETSDA